MCFVEAVSGDEDEAFREIEARKVSVCILLLLLFLEVDCERFGAKNRVVEYFD